MSSRGSRCRSPLVELVLALRRSSYWRMSSVEVQFVSRWCFGKTLRYKAVSGSIRGELIYVVYRNFM